MPLQRRYLTVKFENRWGKEIKLNERFMLSVVLHCSTKLWLVTVATYNIYK